MVDFFVCKKQRTTNELLASNEIMWNSRNHVSFQVQIKSICFSSIMRGVVTESPKPEAHVLCVKWAFRVELEFRSAGFSGEGKTGVPGVKPLGVEKEPTTNLAHIWSELRIEPEATSVGDCASPAPNHKIKKSKFENLNDAYVVPMPMFSICK